MALSCIGKSGGRDAELALQLVGGNRFERRNADNQHHRDGDQATTARNGIDETGNTGGCKEQHQKVEGEIVQGRNREMGMRGQDESRSLPPNGDACNRRITLGCGLARSQIGDKVPAPNTAVQNTRA